MIELSKTSSKINQLHETNKNEAQNIAVTNNKFPIQDFSENLALVIYIAMQSNSFFS